jgi:Bacterial membrane protein YfhO
MRTAPVWMHKRDWLAAAAILAFLLVIAFAPVVFGQKHLMLAAWDAPSITNSGAYDPVPRPPGPRVARTTDPGAPAWTIEPWFKLISEQYWGEFSLPLWNPYNAFGMPLAATAQPQPFFPLTALLSLHVTAWTYSLFILARLLLGGLLTYFLARQFLDFLPSLFAAIAFMLSGHFLLFLNMPHLSVEVLTPGLVLAYEILARRNSWAAVAGVAAMIFLISTGGMPESMFLIVAFGCLYFVCRVLFDPEMRGRAASLFVKFLAAVLFGFALSAFVLLPFVELVRLAFDAHQPSNVGGLRAGLARDGDFASTIQYLLPLILGPPLFSTLQTIPAPSGLRGYWGIMPFFFAVAAVLFACWRRRSSVKSELFVIGFFSITLVLMVLKRYGSPVIHWIGALPLSEMVVYPKYQEPLIALCIAMLAGFGFSALVERRATSRLFLAAAVVVAAAVLATGGTYLPRVLAPELKWAKLFYFVSMAMGAGLLIAIVLSIVLMSRASAVWHPWLARGLVGLLALELFATFIVPCFYLIGSLAPARADPYAGAPYVGFVRGLEADRARVFARGSLLYPNWSAAFGLADVRSLDAIYYDRYRSFMRNFLLPPGDARVHGDLSDRFTGSEFPYQFDSEPERRFLALSSVKHIISDSEYGWPSKWLSEVAEQHRGGSLVGFGPDVFRFGGAVLRTVPGLLQYPPSHRVPYKTVIDPAKPIFEATAVLKNEVAEVSDGAGFRLEVKDGQSIETVFETYLDPRGVPADRAGRAVRVDLSRYAGREIELLFSTDPGPKGDVTGDLAGWAGLRFVGGNEAPPESEFKAIYNGEALVYEVPTVLPRAALFRAVEVLPDDAVLARLKDPGFNPYEKAVVSRESVADGAELSRLTQATPAPPSAARIMRYQSQHVAIEAETPVPALLVLNDTNYPGWRAYVNGQPVDMLTVNFLFRGVMLSPGKSTVEFKYQPRSYRIGGGISFAAVAILAVLVFRERRRRKTRA